MKKKRWALMAGTSSAMLLFGLISSPMALAFSGYGAGTSENPYRIASCSQLGDIDNNLAGYYVLVSNINCTGSTFSHLASSSAFTGTLDGQDHTIANLNVDDYGLFAQTDGATIENLTISSGSLNGASVGSFVDSATDTTFTNVHSNMTVSSTGAYSGGLVGELHGSSSISESSYSGTFASGPSYSGGLVGAMWDSGTSISDSYISGTVTSNSAYVGSIVGGFFNGTVSRVYSSATFNLNGQYYDGGLIGDSQGALNNSFSASSLTGTNNYDGALTGYNVSGTYSGDYFDQSVNNTSTVCGTGSGCSATAENVGNASPDYFQDSVSAGPLSSWNFNSVWTTTAGYPTLTDLAGFTASANIPNDGDANGDGTLDSYEANVLDIEASNGAWATAVVPSSGGCTLGNGQALYTSSIKSDTSYTPDFSPLDFDIYCHTAGTTVPVTIIFNHLYSTASTLRYFNPNTDTYTTIPGATFGTTTIGGQTETTVSYDVTDGGAYDEDGVANGVIVDPVVISSPLSAAATLTNTGLDLTSTGTVSICILIAAILVQFGVWEKLLKSKHANFTDLR